MQKSNLLPNFYKLFFYKKCITFPCKNYYLATQSTNYKNIKNLPAIHSNSLRLAHTEALKCWNCGANRELVINLTCDKCSVLQEPHESENYFKVFDIREDFNVDQKSLTTKYRKLQTVLHPDKFSNKSDKEKSISADYSALVNKAYNTLQLPLNRAIHMLRLRGEKIEEDQKVTDPQFLMEIMELNEEVEAANTPELLKKLNEKNKRVLQEIGQEISNYFKENQVEKAKDSVIKMKYYNSVSLHINGLLRERGIVD